MSDEQLDDFLRKAAEQYDVPYNPHAWEQMNHRLDQASGQGGFWSRKIITGLILLLLLGGGLGIGYQGLYRLDATNSSPSVASTSSAQADTDLAASQEEDTLAQRIPASPSSSQNHTNTVQVVEHEKPAAPVAIRTRSDTSPNASVSKDAPPRATDASSINWVTSRPWVAFHNRLGTVSSVVPIRRPASLPKPPLREAASIHPEPSFARYGLSLGISPDISSVKIGRAAGVGRKVSLQFEYFLFRKVERGNRGHTFVQDLRGFRRSLSTLPWLLEKISASR